MNNLLQEFLISLSAGKNYFHPQLTDFAVWCHYIVGPRRRLDTECQLGSRTFDRTQPVKHEHVFDLLKHVHSISALHRTKLLPPL